MTPTEILTAARALIAEPERWTRGEYARDFAGYTARARSRDAVCWCLAGALRHVAQRRDRFVAEYEVETYLDGAIVAWNDDPNRTHAEVLAAIDGTLASIAAEAQ